MKSKEDIEKRIEELKGIEAQLTQEIQSLQERLAQDQGDLIGTRHRVAELMLLLEDKPVDDTKKDTEALDKS